MIGASERDWMEWQAGYACGAILMPAAALLETVKRFREDKKTSLREPGSWAPSMASNS